MTKEKKEKEGEKIITVLSASDREVWESYLNELVEDLKIIKESLRKLERADFISVPYDLMLYLSDMDGFTNYLADVMSRAKKDWLKTIGLEPFETRKKKIELLEETIKWRLSVLNDVSSNLLTYMKHYCKKSGSEAFIKASVFTIGKAYENKVFNLVGDYSVVLVHKNDLYKALNTVLCLYSEAITDPNAINCFIVEQPKPIEPVATQAMANVFYYNKLENNLLMPSLYEDRIMFDLQFVSKDPFNIEDYTTLQERKDLLTRPNKEDHKLFWGIFLSYLISSSGKGVLRELKEEKKLI